MNRQRDPQTRLLHQAEHCRKSWQHLSREQRQDLASVLQAREEGDLWAQVWLDVVEGRHPLRGWLDGAQPPEALPTAFADGRSVRQIVSFHPFTGRFAWSSHDRSPAFSLVQRLSWEVAR